MKKRYINTMFDCPDKIISKEQFDIVFKQVLLMDKKIPIENFSKNHCAILTNIK